jgi:Ca2+-binding EF-hand superfamily protein
VHGNNYLTTKDIKEQLYKINCPLDDEEINNIVVSCDLNNDGVVNVEEFVKVFIDIPKLEKAFKNIQQALKSAEPKP